MNADEYHQEQLEHQQWLEHEKKLKADSENYDKWNKTLEVNNGYFRTVKKAVSS